MSDKTEEPVVIKLSRDHALILFELLARTSQSPRVDFVDQAERRVLWDLESQLEELLVEPLRGDYGRRLDEALARTRDKEE